MGDEKLTFHICEPDGPYGHLPAIEEAQILGWHLPADQPEGIDWEPRSVQLSDTAVGEPPLDEVTKLISHEVLHDILEQEVSVDASDDLDYIVEAGDYIVDRPENGVQDPRPPKPEWEEEIQEIREYLEQKS